MDLDKYKDVIDRNKDTFNYFKNYHTAELVKMLIKEKGNKKQSAKIAAAIAMRNFLQTITPKTAFRATAYHTDHLIDKVQEKWYSNELSDSKKRSKVAHYCAAIAIRNGIHDDLPLLLELAFKIGKHLI